jgi:hypothetical protein
MIRRCWLLLMAGCCGPHTFIGTPIQVVARPEARLEHVRALAGDGTSVYWLTYGTTNFGQQHQGDGALWSAPREGGPATKLASGLAAPVSLAVDQDAFYFATLGPTNFFGKFVGQGAIARLSRRGGAPIVVAAGQDQPSQLVRHGESLYWAASGGRLLEMPRTGGVPRLLAQGEGWLGDVVVDDDRLYFLRRGTVWTMPRAGGEPRPLVGPPAGAVLHLTADGRDLFWLAKRRGAPERGYVLERMPKAGGPPATVPYSSTRPALWEGAIHASGPWLVLEGFGVECTTPLVVIPREGGEPVLQIPGQGPWFWDDRSIYWDSDRGIQRMAFPAPTAARASMKVSKSRGSWPQCGSP